MNLFVNALAAGLLLVGVTQAPAHAAQWQVCKLHLKVSKLVTQPYPRIQGTVVSIKASSPTVECPMIGEPISFYPETADYQGILPRKKWPNPGQTVPWRYIYLDGNCKNRGACRIKHHPVGW